MDHSLIESNKSCVPQWNITFLVPCCFSETTLCFWDCWAHCKAQVWDLHMRHRNVMFAEVKPTVFTCKPQWLTCNSILIDLQFNIKSKTNRRDSSKSHTNKTMTLFSLWFISFPLLCFLSELKKMKWSPLQGSVFNYMQFPQQLCNSLDGFILIKPAGAQGWESALTFLIIRRIYGKIVTAPPLIR